MYEYTVGSCGLTVFHDILRRYMKTTSKKTSPKKVKNDIPVFDEEPTLSIPQAEPKTESTGPKRNWVVWLALGIAIGIVVSYRGLPIAAIVNRDVVFRREVDRVLYERYGAQTLDGIITERLLAQEAKAKGISVEQAAIEARENEILAQFGATGSVDEFLSLQGISRDEFQRQLSLNIMVERLLESDIQVSDSEVATYIASNSAMLIATDSAGQREEARTQLRQQKLQGRLFEYLEELRNKAMIRSLL